jgi:hypothetical protein
MARFMLLILVLTVWGCSPSPAIQEPTIRESAESAKEMKAYPDIPLRFVPSDPSELPKEKPKPQWNEGQTYRYADEFRKGAYTVHLYVDASEKPAADGDVYAFVEYDGAWYDAGLVSSYGLKDIEVKARQLTEDGKRSSLLQMAGGIGASYVETKFIGFDNATGVPVLLLASGLIESELTDSGDDVLFGTTAGVIPSTVWAIRMRDGRMEQADVAADVEQALAMGHSPEAKAPAGAAFLEKKNGLTFIRYERPGLAGEPAPALYFRYEAGKLIAVS